jgi:hypothetical protein
MSGGSGDDTLNSDIFSGEPPTPALDPNPNHDSCDGGSGTNQFFFCET